MIRFLVDTASDYTIEEISQLGLDFVPMPITLGDKTFLDCVDIERNEFYDLMAQTEDFPKTSQPASQDFIDCFKKVKENGDKLICVLISSEMSGTFQSANLAKSMVDYDGIHIIDSLGASYVIKVIVDYGLKLRDAGESYESIIEKLEIFKTKIKLYAVLDTLDNLYRGGRLSKTVAGIGTLAKVKPIITFTEEGEIGIVSKAIGRKKAAAGIIDIVKKKDLDPEFPIYALKSFGEDNHTAFIEKLKSSGINVDDVLQIGATIGIHIGPGAFGIIVVEK